METDKATIQERLLTNIAELRKIQSEDADAFKGVTEKTLNNLAYIEAQLQGTNTVLTKSGEVPTMSGSEEDDPDGIGFGAFKKAILDKDRGVQTIQTTATNLKKEFNDESLFSQDACIAYLEKEKSSGLVFDAFVAEFIRLVKALEVDGNIKGKAFCDAFADARYVIDSKSDLASIYKNGEGVLYYKKDDVDGEQTAETVFGEIADCCELAQSWVNHVLLKAEEAEEGKLAEEERLAEEKAKAEEYNGALSQWYVDCVAVIKSPDTTVGNQKVSQKLLLEKLDIEIPDTTHPVYVALNWFCRNTLGEDDTTTYVTNVTLNEAINLLEPELLKNKEDATLDLEKPETWDTEELFIRYKKEYSTAFIAPGTINAWINQGIPTLLNKHQYFMDDWCSGVTDVVSKNFGQNVSAKFVKSRLIKNFQEAFSAKGEDYGSFYENYVKEGLESIKGDKINVEDLDILWKGILSGIAKGTPEDYQTYQSNDINITDVQEGLPTEGQLLIALTQSRYYQPKPVPNNDNREIKYEGKWDTNPNHTFVATFVFSWNPIDGLTESAEQGLTNLVVNNMDIITPFVPDGNLDVSDGVDDAITGEAPPDTIHKFTVKLQPEDYEDIMIYNDVASIEFSNSSANALNYSVIGCSNKLINEIDDLIYSESSECIYNQRITFDINLGSPSYEESASLVVGTAITHGNEDFVTVWLDIETRYDSAKANNGQVTVTDWGAEIAEGGFVRRITMDSEIENIAQISLSRRNLDTKK